MTTHSPAACPFTVAYEVLRAWATARPRASRSPPGALVFLRRGLAAWLGEWPRLVSAARQPVPPRANDDEVSPPGQALAAVLAGMIEQYQQEQAR